MTQDKTRLCEGSNKKKPYYGYLVINILSNTLKLTVFTLVVTVTFLINLPWYVTFILFIAELSYFIKIILHGRNFSIAQRIIVKKIIDLSEIDGDEILLDFGTGDGILAVNFAKHFKNGIVYGIDRWRWPFSFILTSPFLMATLMTGCTKQNAESNASLEGVSDKCRFITGNFTEGLDFPDRYFDVVVSSQSLYFIKSTSEQQNLFNEINRILKKDGKIIFYEPERPYENINWNMASTKRFFEGIEYDMKKTPLHELMGWRFDACILMGKKSRD